MDAPQIENGYTKIANELLEAISKVNLSSYEFRVMLAIIRKTYGFNKKHDWLSLSQIEEITNIKSHNVCRTIKKLVDKNMLLKNGKITGIQKQYKKWKTIQTDNIQTDNIQTDNIIQIDNPIIQIDNLALSKQIDTKETITKETITKEIYKDKYLDHVYLFATEYQKLLNEYGEKKAKEMIKRLNNYIWQIGVKKAQSKYKSHYHTILNWIRMDEDRNNKNIKPDETSIYKKI